MKKAVSLLLSIFIIFGLVSGVSAQDTSENSSLRVEVKPIYFSSNDQPDQFKLEFTFNFGETVENPNGEFLIPYNPEIVSYVSLDEDFDVTAEEVDLDPAKSIKGVKVLLNTEDTIYGDVDYTVSLNFTLNNLEQYYTGEKEEIVIPFPTNGLQTSYTLTWLVNDKSYEATGNIWNVNKPPKISFLDPTFVYKQPEPAVAPLTVTTGPVNNNGTFEIKWTIKANETIENYLGDVGFAWNVDAIQKVKNQPVEIKINGVSLEKSQYANSDYVDIEHIYFWLEEKHENYQPKNIQVSEYVGVANLNIALNSFNKGDTITVSFPMEILNLSQYKANQEINYLDEYYIVLRDGIKGYKYFIDSGYVDGVQVTGRYTVPASESKLIAPSTIPAEAVSSVQDTINDNVPSELPKTEAINGGTIQTAPLTTATEKQQAAVAEVLSSKNKLTEIFKQFYDVPTNADFILIGGAEYTLSGGDGGPVRMRVTLENTNPGDTIYALHYDGNEWEIVQALVGENGSFEIEFNSLSPVLYYKVAVDGKPVELVSNSVENAPATGTFTQEVSSLLIVLFLSLGVAISTLIIKRANTLS